MEHGEYGKQCVFENGIWYPHCRVYAPHALGDSKLAKQPVFLSATVCSLSFQTTALFMSWSPDSSEDKRYLKQSLITTGREWSGPG